MQQACRAQRDPWSRELTGLGHWLRGPMDQRQRWGFLASCKSAKMLSETREVELIKDNWEGRRKLRFIEFQFCSTGPMRED